MLCKPRAVVDLAWFVHPSRASMEDNPLELEHMMGFAGYGKGSVQFHPTDPDVMISYTGRHVIISNTKDPHQQEFLRAHNEEITILALSPMGNMIASGQVSSTRVPDSEAAVIVWDYKTRTPIYKLIELHDGVAFSRNKVIQLSFSPDEVFLAGCDDNPKGAKLCVWHTQTGQLTTISKTGQRPASFLAWGEVVPSTKSKKNATYKLISAIAHKVFIYTLEFDIYTMQYAIKSDVIQLPSSGLERSYHCAMSLNETMLAAGSHAGELIIFQTRAGVSVLASRSHREDCCPSPLSRKNHLANTRYSAAVATAS